MPTNQENTPIAHTPGPWRADSEGAVRDAAGNEVAHVIRTRDLPLIAAAPELLASLRKAADLAEIAYSWDLGEGGRIEISGGWVNLTDLKDEFEAAIAKAEGKPTE